MIIELRETFRVATPVGPATARFLCEEQYDTDYLIVVTDSGDCFKYPIKNMPLNTNTKSSQVLLNEGK